MVKPAPGAVCKARKNPSVRRAIGAQARQHQEQIAGVFVQLPCQLRQAERGVARRQLQQDLLAVAQRQDQRVLTVDRKAEDLDTGWIDRAIRAIR